MYRLPVHDRSEKRKACVTRAFDLRALGRAPWRLPPPCLLLLGERLADEPHAPRARVGSIGLLGRSVL